MLHTSLLVMRFGTLLLHYHDFYTNLNLQGMQPRVSNGEWPKETMDS